MRPRHILPLLAALSVAVAWLSLSTGTLSLSPQEVWRALTGEPAAPAHGIAVVGIRLPRLLVAAGAGAALALSGAILQAVLRNPLAEPGVLGISAGSALGVALAHAGMLSIPAPPAALSGGLVAVLMILLLAGTPDPVRLILAGIGVGALAGAALSFLSVAAPVSAAQQILAWIAGDLNGAGPDRAALVWLGLALGLPLSALCLRHLDLIALDPASAVSLGLDPRAARLALIGLAVLLAATATAAAGIVVFVGLVGPHMARRMAGARHAAMLPAAVATGALLVAIADLAGRTVFAPVQVPAGIVAALVGAPWFLYMMRRTRHG